MSGRFCRVSPGVKSLRATSPRSALEENLFHLSLPMSPQISALSCACPLPPSVGRCHREAGNNGQCDPLPAPSTNHHIYDWTVHGSEIAAKTSSEVSSETIFPDWASYVHRN